MCGNRGSVLGLIGFPLIVWHITSLSISTSPSSFSSCPKLPGDLQSKVDPYLRPLYDALHQIMGPESFAKNMEKGLIEVAPLAYMRGRTLDNAYIILDEAQNTTPAQMKMFLTRIGFGSKVVVTGDASQKDLPAGSHSGLDVAARRAPKPPRAATGY